MAKKSKDEKQVKMGTFAGVFIPTSLNIFSILVFLRFGFILGQVGVYGFVGMLLICYAVDLLTFSSLSAIATNGSVRGGGAYYLISRSLGAEFGGAIGIVYYLGMTVNSGMNSVGLAQVLTYNFGPTGSWGNWMPAGFWWSYLFASCVLLLVTAVCLAGSSLFSRAGNFLFVVVVVVMYSVPLSALLVRPFTNEKIGVEYTGISSATFKSNLLPNFTSGADGSNKNGKEDWQSLFSILFPATAGIFAGASMSGDLKNPRKAIPNGTLYGLILTFITYMLLIMSMASTSTRSSLRNNSNILQDTSIAGMIIIVGELSVTFFGALLGMYSSAKLLQALARDRIFPGLSIFGQGSSDGDEPRYAILITYAISQVAMLADLNQLASLVGMSILLTFLVTNFACFLLDVGSAPNFRPSFRYFSWQSAAIGTIVSCAIMLYVNGEYSAGALTVMTILFLIVHYASPPKAWGDVSQSLIYHQVRKYLLRLRQDHVKSWRPSVLLVINDPRQSFKLVQFCNSLKKGALFILGHVIVTDDFKGGALEHKKQLSSWTKFIDISKIKAFTNITVSPRVEWGIRNLVLTSGLGGMRPNVVVLGFFNLSDLRNKQPLITIPSPQPSRPVSRRNSSQKISSMWSKVKKGALPTDADKREGPITAHSYVTVLEDLLHGIQINVAVAKGFDKLKLPADDPPFFDTLRNYLRGFGKDKEEFVLQYIDLWPIQMSSFTEVETGNGYEKKNVLTSNFDTYTLILQLGAILETVPAWQRTHRIRISVFVEYENEVEQERKRLTSLLGSLRIHADIRVYWLAEGDLQTYESIVNGSRSEEYTHTLSIIDDVLADEPWWKEIQDARRDAAPSADLRELVNLESATLGTPNWRKMPLPKATGVPDEISMAKLKKMMKRMKKGVGHLDKYHPAMRVKLSNLDQQLIDHYDVAGSDSDGESSDEEDDSSASTKFTGDLLQSNRGDVQAVESVMSHPRRSAGFRRMDSSSSSLKRPSVHPDAAASENLLANERWAQATSRSPSRAVSPSLGTPASPMGSYRRQSISRNSSMPKFSSRPVPPTHIKHDIETGPSISFAEQHIAEDDEEEPTSSKPSEEASRSSTPPLEIAPRSNSKRLNDTNDENTHSAEQASGFPFMSSVPLSFNDLPSRAQNLILNELMVQHSSDAGVVFTTLPSPVDGTGESEEDSVRYLSDLEVLCQDLPPTLLVHCNTVTVTVSL